MLEARLSANTPLAAAGLLLGIAAVLLGQQLLGGRASAAPRAAVAKSVTLATKTFRVTQPDLKQRLVVPCPGRTRPLGGGMTTSPPPGPDGEGVYPQSYERLGVQRGWHVTAMLIDPNRGNTQPRDVTLQVVCGPRRGHVTPPHRTKFIKPGQTKKAVANCPGRRHLFAGGFQRTNFSTGGGAFAIESRAVSSKAWRVVGHAFGTYGGEITAIAYCLRSKGPLLSEVSASTTLGAGALGTATTPACPAGQRLTSGGFSGPHSGSARFTDGWINADGTWSASGFNFGAAAGLTAYGYCLRV
jgi:hypothetical protein